MAHRPFFDLFFSLPISALKKQILINTIDLLCLSNNQILFSLVLSLIQIHDFEEEEADEAALAKADDWPQQFQLKCHICHHQPDFDAAEDYKKHFKSQLHRSRV